MCIICSKVVTLYLCDAVFLKFRMFCFVILQVCLLFACVPVNEYKFFKVLHYFCSIFGKYLDYFSKFYLNYRVCAVSKTFFYWEIKCLNSNISLGVNVTVLRYKLSIWQHLFVLIMMFILSETLIFWESCFRIYDRVSYKVTGW